jgi:DNA-binding response OmpR family regulator
MRRIPVLLLGSHKNKELTDALTEAGFEPIVRRTMLEALDKIRRRAFSAVVIDRDVTDVDLLEFTFNVRDYRPDVPIIVVGEKRRTPTDRMAMSLPGTVDLGSTGDLAKRASRLKRAINTGMED